MRGLGLGVMWMCVLGLGCGRGADARLLELTAASPEVLDGHGSLWLTGHGFAVGEPCEVWFEGQLYQAARKPRPVRLTLRGRAVSGERVQVPFRLADLDALGGPGSFEGRVGVAFATRRRDGRVVGELPTVRLDLLPDTPGRARAERALEPRARALLDALGVSLRDDTSRQSGLVVSALREASPAAAAGLLPGDRVVRLSGLGVHALADFVPTPGAAELALSVHREGHVAPLTLRVPSPAGGAQRLDARRARYSLIAGGLLLCFLFLSPFRWPTRWLHRLRARHARGLPPPEVGLWGMSRALWRQVDARPGLRVRLHATVLPLLVSGLWALLVFFQALSGVTFNSLRVYLALGASSIALTLLDAGHGSGRARLAEVGRQLPRMLGLAVVIVCACALSGTRSLEGIVAHQGAAPWAWGMFQCPALSFAFPLFVVHAARSSWAAYSPDATPAPLRAGLEVTGRVFMCGVGVAIFLGGWQTDGLPCPAWLEPRLLGALLFVAKAWALAYLLFQTRRLGVGERDTAARTALGAVVVLAFSALWLWLDPSELTRVATGYVAFGVAALALPMAALQAGLVHVGLARAVGPRAPA